MSLKPVDGVEWINQNFLSVQVISVFTLVEVQLKSDDAPLKYSAVLKRPEDSAS